MSRETIPALVPAAGQSRRMGRPKLILPLAHGQTVIETVMTALRDGGADPILLVVPPEDEPGAVELARLGEWAGAIVITCPTATADMRQTVLLGLERLDSNPPGILLVPGDSPGVTAVLVDRVRQAFFQDPSAVVIPTHEGKRGHPVALPRSVYERIAVLPPNQGINALVRDPSTKVKELAVDHPGLADDLDTPDDYRRWLAVKPAL